MHASEIKLLDKMTSAKSIYESNIFQKRMLQKYVSGMMLSHTLSHLILLLQHLSMIKFISSTGYPHKSYNIPPLDKISPHSNLSDITNCLWTNFVEPLWASTVLV